MNVISSEEQTLYQLLNLIDEGSLTVVNHQGEEFIFGKVNSSPKLRLVITSPETYRHIVAFASLGFGESYIYGWWNEENNNLVELAGMLISSGIYSKAKGNMPLVLKVIKQRLFTLPNLVKNSIKNVQHHYDLGNDFYRFFLDNSLTYSCGYQIQDDDTLEEMQTQKYELICKKLSLKSGDRIIDIGCGWGSMLIYAAEKYGISGTGITLSKEQANLAIERINRRGLSKYIEIVLSDYREIEGQYDKLISIGMFEHVGQQNFSTFMLKASSLLKPEGVGLLHTIGTVGRKGRDPWIEKYIFPGGYLPKLHQLTEEMYKANLLIAHCENLKPHYAKTLNLWSKNFRSNKDKIMSLSEKYDLQFMRTWEFYLQVCEATFLYGNSQLYQILFCKGKQWQFEKNLMFQFDKPSTDIWEPTNE
jgi:cyclopropane-fatty-acyl-phospholipid synthase